ncbi:hypothetical protein D3C84_1052790 [compost metagenome]
MVVVVNSDAHQFSDQTGGHGSQARQASDLQLAEHWGLATDDCFGQRVERDGVRPVRVSQYVMYRQDQTFSTHLHRHFVATDYVANQVVVADHKVNRLQDRLIQLDDRHS